MKMLEDIFWAGNEHNTVIVRPADGEKSAFGDKLGIIKVAGKKEPEDELTVYHQRAKNEDATMCKLLGKESCDEKELRDLLGARFEVGGTAEAIDLMQQIYSRIEPLVDEKAAFEWSHRDMLSSEEEKQFLDFLEKNKRTKKMPKHKTEKNRNSSEEYEDFKIRGKITFPNGKKHTVEIQIVLDPVKNNNGFSHHIFYESVSRRVDVLTRLYGYARESWLSHAVEKAQTEYEKERKKYNRRKISVKEVWEYMLHERALIKKITLTNGRVGYASNQIMQRWEERKQIKETLEASI